MNETFEKDGIYELYNDEYIDLSNLVTIGKVSFDDWRTASTTMEDIHGHVCFNCIFRFVKGSTMIHDSEHLSGIEEIEKRKKKVEVERQKLIKAWRKYKEANK